MFRCECRLLIMVDVVAGRVEQGLRFNRFSSAAAAPVAGLSSPARNTVGSTGLGLTVQIG